jgi:transcriptional regulator with XRE-family HTH domain
VSEDTSFGALVKSRRVALGMSQAALADLVGRSASAVRSWEREASTPTDEGVVHLVSAVLGIEEETLRQAVGLPPITEVGSETIAGAALETFVGAPEPAVTVDTPAGEGASDAVESIPTTAPIEEVLEVEPSETEVVVPIEETGVEDDLEPSQTPAGFDDETGFEAEPAVEAEVDEAPQPEEAPDLDEEPPADESEGSGPAPPVVAGLQVAATPGSESEVTAIEPVVPEAARTRAASTQVVQETPVPGPRSYLEDPDQMMTYWVRSALTVALAVFLLIVLFWALGQLSDSLGEVWEIFKSGS